MATRIQVVLEQAERERFRALAEAENVSLSAWVRQAARHRADQTRERFTSAEALMEFIAKHADQAPDLPAWEVLKMEPEEGRLRHAIR